MKFNYKLYLIFLAFIATYSGFSQDSTLTIKYKTEEFNPFKGNYIKFSPFSLLEIEPAVQLGYEYNASPKIRIQHEIGYLSLFNPAYAIFHWGNNFNNISSAGVRIRTTLKFPLKLDNMKVRNKHKYLGIDVMFKYLTITETDVNIRRLGAYWELMDITSSKYVGAIHFVYGINNYLSRSNNIITDSYLGIGIRYKSLSDNTPYDVSYDNRPWWDEMNGLMISAMLGIKIGFGI